MLTQDFKRKNDKIKKKNEYSTVFLISIGNTYRTIN